jgi:uncharacterized protein (TIGR03435 family)
LVGTSGNLYRRQAIAVADLIRDAYSVKDYQIAGGPPWVASDGDQFDIAAKAAEAAPSEAQFRSMLQTLLADRFHLKLHRERRELPVYELVVAKGGPKFTEVPAGAKPLDRQLSPGAPTRGTMEFVLAMVFRFADRPIVDRTGLKASEYEFRFNAREVAAEVQQGARPAPSIFSAVQQQLGLRLQPAKALVDVLVIDHVEKPTEN